MENYTKEELRSFLDRDDPPPTSLKRKQIREWLEAEANKRAEEVEKKLSDIARKLEGLMWANHAFVLIVLIVLIVFIVLSISICRV